jgi:hypothetical protein
MQCTSVAPHHYYGENPGNSMQVETGGAQKSSTTQVQTQSREQGSKKQLIKAGTWCFNQHRLSAYHQAILLLTELLRHKSKAVKC